MTTQLVFIHGPWAPAVDLKEQKKPTHGLVFSGGSPRAPYALRLWERQHQCLRLTINTRLSESLDPGTHYWFSKDMSWWSSAAKRVLDDIHLLLTRQSHGDKTLLFRVCLRGPWRCGPWKSDATWLSRFIHHYYKGQGTILHPVRQRIDKHRKDFPDTVHFDLFLLQCWHEGFFSGDQARTYEIIERINNKAPKICLSTIQGYMNSIAPASAQQEQHQGPLNNDTWITIPHANLAQWDQCQRLLAQAHRALFADYARHLMAELKLELERRFPDGWDFPPQSREAYLSRRRRRQMARRMVAYVDCVIILAQRELGMVRNSQAALLRPSSAVSLLPSPVSRRETRRSELERPAKRPR